VGLVDRALHDIKSMI